MEQTRHLKDNNNLIIHNPECCFKFCIDGVACKDENLKYIYVNKNFCNLFGSDVSDTFMLKPYNDYLSPANIKLIQNVDTEIKNKLYPISYIISTVNGNVINMNSSPIVKENHFCGILTIARDITQEENLKTTFVNKHFEYIDSEKQLQKQRETFVASIGHDLKNPTIAQIRGLELLINGSFGEISSKQKEILVMILDSCRYMKGMLSSLLDTYRNCGGIITLSFSKFSMSELVNECTSEMLYVAKDKNLIINNKKVLKDINVEADELQIKRVIMNLLTNAIKYAFCDTQLTLNVYNESGYVHFEFENESPYIPPEKQERIFAKYVSFCGVNKELGIGLGLYASKKIIESHDGCIYFTSFEENKNIFGFKIPEKQNSNKSKKVCL